MSGFRKCTVGLLVVLGSLNTARANEFEHIWSCTLLPGKTLDEARLAASGWLRAAQDMPGGEGLAVILRWPIAVPDSTERFEFVIRAPSLGAWGTFYDRYDPDSSVGKADETFAQVASCSGSTLWESIGVDGAKD